MTPLQLLKRCALSLYGPECAKCGHVAARPQLDHIRPVSTHGALRLDPHNVQILCPDCNRLKGDTVRDYRSGDLFVNVLRLEYIDALAQAYDDRTKMMQLLVRAKDLKRGRHKT